MKIRMKFTKLGSVKYVGHLDTMRLFQRAIKVAAIPVAYSQGFSPHSLVYFAMPLAVGMSSIGEYMDMITTEVVKPAEVKEQLNRVLVEGIEIIDAFVIEEDKDSLMSLVKAADYRITLTVEDKPFIKEMLIKKLEGTFSLLVEKKGKKELKQVDIRPLILKAAVSENEEGLIIDAMVLAGSAQNLHPELLLKALMGEEALSYTACITRKELYTGGQEGFIPLDAFGILS